MSDLTAKWAEVEKALQTADSIAFDGCHKIYVAMDVEQTETQESYGYGEDNPEWLTRITRDAMGDGLTPVEALERLKDWYDQSCFLKFISAVSTVEGDPNKGYKGLISQFDSEEEA